MKLSHICLTVATLLASAACEPLKQNLDKAVVINYDDSAHFRGYIFKERTELNWQGALAEKGIYGEDRSPPINGYWATFVLCDLRNEGEAAETFTLDLSKFYVEYDDKRHYYTPLSPWTFSSWPSRASGYPSVTPTVNKFFREETQLGPDTNQFQKGFYPAVNYRLSIYVTKNPAGVLNADQPLTLRYDGYPMILGSRNQPPAVLDTVERGNLETVCRAPG
jgi:hypothetical protein